ncbi:GNAT family N-acetyltransferase [Paenibacillus sp. FSL W8-1187]|uniref:Acetyltransferase, GNAT family n=1 Tax=Paenibacillus pasadenensis TaxID=217090 RepID=A0A2N5N7I5_9BACL|nr:GNAT family N-acetyltransferase [Paenibacillus pasadenensis]PLT46314.1 acetyltransferase, GNAT family [Paenibacillus pasadenensis]
MAEGGAGDLTAPEGKGGWIDLRTGPREERNALLARSLFDPGRAAEIAARYESEPELELAGRIEQGRLVGLAGWRREADGGVELRHLAVLPEAERCGIGRRLVRHALERSAAGRLVAETDDDAVGFYRRIGCTARPLGELHPGRERWRCELRRYGSREPEAADFEKIAGWPRSRAEAYYMFPSGGWPLRAERLQARAAERRLPTLMLDASGTPAAYANVYEDEGQWWIGNVIVNPELRGRGAAEALLLKLCRDAGERLGADELHLVCHSPNAKALLLYSGLGWEPYRILRKLGPELEPLAGIAMKKRLESTYSHYSGRNIKI